MVSNLNNPQILWLMHLVSPTLPVGAYSYSEGLETWVEQGRIKTAQQLTDWLIFELKHGAVRVETVMLLRAHTAATTGNAQELSVLHHWLSAFRETEELRSQSLQMGRSLLKLLADTQVLPQTLGDVFLAADSGECHFAIAFAIAAAIGHLSPEHTLLGYLQSWVANLVNAGVRLIPLGQTAGQQILLDVYPVLSDVVPEILTLTDDELWGCSWGNSLASMQHETQYSRLFRS